MRKAIVIYHSGYGCESGCCGHVLELGDAASPHDQFGFDAYEKRRFRFSHPWDDDLRAWAEDLVASEFGDEHVADLDWENCLIVDD